jgi:RNA polymerase sigma-B factor
MTTESDNEVLALLHRRYAASRDPRLRAELLRHYDGLAIRLARRFSSPREATEDLIQVARVGLIHAVDRFDPGRERPFVAFAETTIVGQLKRHLRDHTWRIRPPRRLQESYLAVIRTLDDLTHELRRSPTIPELAARAGLPEEEVLEAVDVIRSMPLSLDRPDDDGRTAEVAAPDGGFARVEEHLLVRSLLRTLNEDERRIVRLRFAEQLTQAEIALLVGRNQMYVSRLLSRLEGRLRARAADGAA